MHFGIHVNDVEAADRFYKDILGFQLLWKGGPRDDRFDWISMKVKPGGDWVEYMAGAPNPTLRQLGGMHHFCLEFADVDAIATAQRVVAERAARNTPKPFAARDGRLAVEPVRSRFDAGGVHGAQARAYALLQSAAR